MKKLYRIFNKENGQPVADYITMADEPEPEGNSIVIFDPVDTWKRKRCENVEIRPIQERIFDHGKCIYQVPSLKEIQNYCRDQVAHLWDEVKRFENPHRYYVDLSEKLWQEKNRLLSEHVML